MGRPKKAVSKTKKVKLTAEQKSYAKMLKDVEKHLEAKKPLIEALDAKITKLTAKYTEELKELTGTRALLDGETRSLVGAKHSLESILNKIPPPPGWVDFTKQVYEYHYHYHNCGCKLDHGCPCVHYPIIYNNPWWGWYNGGGYIHYPTWSQIYSGNPTGLAMSGNLSITTTTSDLNGVAGTYVNVPGSLNGGASLSGINNVGSVVDCTGVVDNSSQFTCLAQNGTWTVSSSSLVPTAVNAVMFSNVAVDDADVAASVNALQAVGFFDSAAPQIP
jgi:hypothetical protein